MLICGSIAAARRCISSASGMVVRFRQHARDHAALAGHAQTLFDAELFDPIHQSPSLGQRLVASSRFRRRRKGWRKPTSIAGLTLSKAPCASRARPRLAAHGDNRRRGARRPQTRSFGKARARPHCPRRLQETSRRPRGLARSVASRFKQRRPQPRRRAASARKTSTPPLRPQRARTRTNPSAGFAADARTHEHKHFRRARAAKRNASSGHASGKHRRMQVAPAPPHRSAPPLHMRCLRS